MRGIKLFKDVSRFLDDLSATINMHVIISSHLSWVGRWQYNPISQREQALELSRKYENQFRI